MMSNSVRPEETTSERMAAIRAWMEESGIDLSLLADMAGCSDVFMRVLLRRETMPVKRYRQMIALGVPAECLPVPVEPVMGRPRKPPFGKDCVQVAEV